MKNLTFVEYLAALNILDDCIILAEYLWQPTNEDNAFWDFSHNMLSVIYEDYRKEYDETETLLLGIQDIVYVSRVIEKQAEERGRKEREKREASASLFE